ncbi:MAG: response regulator [Phycisphaerales bacterium]
MVTASPLRVVGVVVPAQGVLNRNLVIAVGQLKSGFRCSRVWRPTGAFSRTFFDRSRNACAAVGGYWTSEPGRPVRRATRAFVSCLRRQAVRVSWLVREAPESIGVFFFTFAETRDEVVVAGDRCHVHTCPENQGTMKILTVDDSATARLIVKQTMEGEGHTVLEAPDGAVALSVLKAQPSIDLIVLDWNMPVMNGLECLKAIRRNPEFKSVKVVMCTTEAEKASIMAAIKAGANGYVLKPVTSESLIAGVNKALGVVKRQA